MLRTDWVVADDVGVAELGDEGGAGQEGGGLPVVDTAEDGVLTASFCQRGCPPDDR
jgi:hypothetical protein